MVRRYFPVVDQTVNRITYWAAFFVLVGSGVTWLINQTGTYSWATLVLAGITFTCFVALTISAFLTAWRYFWPLKPQAAGQDKAKQSTDTRFLTRQSLTTRRAPGMEPAGASQPIAIYSIQFARSAARVRAFLDFSVEISPTSRRRVELSDLPDVYAGQEVNIVVATQTVDAQGHRILRWGTKTEGEDFAGLYYARIVLDFGSSNDAAAEHTFYFLITPTVVNGYPFIFIVDQERLDFRKAWDTP